MSLTVKVFYEPANGPNEIRRFPVSTGQNVDIFIETKAKIRQLFPSLAHGNFSLYWQDSDGDRVAFSTSEEMKDAIAYTSDGVLRVYVSQSTASPETEGQKEHKAPGKEQQKQPSDTQTADPGHSSFPGSVPNPDGGSYSFNFGPLPPGFPDFIPNSDEGPPPYNFGPAPPVVTCDGCSSQISGLLYKCCNCVNYNLCQTCAGKGQHSEHTMLRIPLPNFSFPPFNSQQFNFPPQPSFSFHTFGPGMPAGTYSSTGTFGPGMPAGTYSSTNIFGPGMPTGTFSSASTTCNSFNGAKPGHNAEKHTDGQTGTKSNQSGFNYHKAGTNIPPSPFGIKVSCNVKDCTKGNVNNGAGCNANNGAGCNANNGAGNQKQENFQHSWWGQGSGCPGWGGMYWGAPQGMAADGLQPRGTDEAATKMEGGSKDGAPKNESNQAHGIAGNKSGSEGNSQWSEAHAEQIKLQIPTTFAIPLPFPTSISVSMPNSQPQPTTVTASSPNPAVTPQTTSSSGFASFTAASTGHQASSPQDARIQECLDRMLTMGFSDLDGSLFALLLEHEGDIGSTIDALKAKASQNTGTPRGGR